MKGWHQIGKGRYGLEGLVTLFVLFFFVYPLAFIGADDIRMVEVFVTDEAEFLLPVMGCLERGDFNIGRYDYGLLYYNIGLVILFLLKPVIGVSEFVSVVVFRLLSFASLLGTSWILKIYVERFLNRSGTWVYAISLLGSLTLLKYSVMLHPDVTQVFFVAFSLYLLARFVQEAKIAYLYWAAVLCGMSFATKFAGVALLPLLIVGLFKHIRKYKPSFLTTALLTVLALVTAFLSDATFIGQYLTEQGDTRNDLLFLFSLLRWISFAVAGYGILVLIFNNRLPQIWKGPIPFLEKSYWIGGFFWLGFALGTPQSIKGFNFLNGLIYVTGLHREGHWFKEESGVWSWIRILVENDVLHPLWFVLALLGIAVGIWEVFRTKSHLLAPRLLPLYWVLLFCFVVVFRVNSHFKHYLIPALPFLFLYSAIGVSFLTRQVAGWSWKSNPDRVQLFSRLVGLGVAVVLMIQVQQYALKKEAVVVESDALEAGRWLKANVAEEVFILADKYTYIPKAPHMNYASYFGLSPIHFEMHQPDMLIISKEIYRRFQHIEDVDGYLYGRQVFLERNELYTALLNDTHQEFKLLKDFGEVKVYRRAAEE